LAEQELRLSLHLKLISSPPDPLVVDLAMSLLVRALRVLMDPSYTPLRVELRRPRPADVAPYERFFRCTVEFGAASDVITFRGGELDRPLPGANPELAKHCDALIREYLARAENASIVDRLRAKLASETAESIAPVQIARSLGMSERSLQRVLAKHNTTYLRVLNETRRDLACAYLCDRDRSMAAIACCLGFRDASSFARAFRRWTGTSPSQYRQTLFIA
jgi:AraC-like DNA-binding protein